MTGNLFGRGKGHKRLNRPGALGGCHLLSLRRRKRGFRGPFKFRPSSFHIVGVELQPTRLSEGLLHVAGFSRKDFGVLQLYMAVMVKLCSATSSSSVCLSRMCIHQHTLRNIPEERRPQLHRGGCLKSRTAINYLFL